MHLTLAAFFDGGWFGPNSQGPGAGGALTPDYLSEPAVQVSTDGGVTWTAKAASSDYLTSLTGATIGGGANPNPQTLSATFTLSAPVSNINAIRLIGTEGGTASDGFLGVFELAVLTSGPQSVKLTTAAVVGGQFQFEFDSQTGVSHVVQFKNGLADATWQTLTTIAGDGTRKQVTDSLKQAHRFYRLTSQ